MTSPPLSRQTNIVVQKVENELLIYDLSNNKAFCLNETSAMIWQLCDGANSVADISRYLSRILNASLPEELVWLALDRLKKDNLLEKSDEFAIDFGGLNRREVIRKVGLGSLVALPLIASIIAPSALLAQSGSSNLPLLSVCTDDSQCTSGNCLTVQNPLGLLCCSVNTTSSSPIRRPGFSRCVNSVQQCNNFASSCCSGDTRSRLIGCPGNDIECVCR